MPEQVTVTLTRDQWERVVIALLNAAYHYRSDDIPRALALAVREWEA